MATTSPLFNEAGDPLMWVRVRQTDTGHELDVHPSVADGPGYVRVNAPKAYPDLYGDAAQPRLVKYRTDKGGSSPATPTSQES